MPTSFTFNKLFEDVQVNRVFPDGKTFVDCVPRLPEADIIAAYEWQKKQPGFSLRDFVLEHYELPVAHSTHYKSDATKTVEENIESLWPVLTREPDEKKGTLIPLPHPYIVPGGRFGEIYYWDSFFTMLGLKASGKTQMVENMVRNFSYLIDTVGYIPNGNRSYFIGRSQPPFYSQMLALLADIKGDTVWTTYRPQLEKEYQFWMKDAESLSDKETTIRRVVRMPGGEIMNRYWDELDRPRPESYREDVELSHLSGEDPRVLYRHLRAGAESGWDYSSRWLKDGKSLSTIHTTDIVPVDLNCLLLHLEQSLAKAVMHDREMAVHFTQLAEKRRAAIQRYCWNETDGIFTDFDWSVAQPTSTISLACAFPLYFGVASPAQAAFTASWLEHKFLAPGGLSTTLATTGQQWDAPNGWAPLHWIAIMGLERYGHHNLAAEIARRWLKLNMDVFARTGKLMEKYNVRDTGLEAGGGEYEGQDGFGWTNGVFLALLQKYGHP